MSQIRKGNGYRIITPIFKKGDFGYNITTITVICGGEHGCIYCRVSCKCNNLEST